MAPFGKKPLPALVIALSLLAIVQMVNGAISDPHWIPEDPRAGEEVEIFVSLTPEEPENVTGARLRSEYETTSLLPYNGTPENGGSVVYRGVMIFSTNGTFDVSAELLIEGEWIEEGSFEIVVEESEDAEEETIFGMPRWYCSVSVIFLTIILIFLTWSYFKGRSIQKQKERMARQVTVECSECGRPVGEERFCRWCGSELETEEFVCGECGETVEEETKRCPSCGANLLPGKGPGDEIKAEDRSVGKRSGRSSKKDEKEKWTCSGCGTVLMASESRCPVCGKRERA